MKYSDTYATWRNIKCIYLIKSVYANLKRKRRINFCNAKMNTIKRTTHNTIRMKNK